MSDGSTTAMLLSAIGAMTGAISYLVKVIFDYHGEVQKKLGDCERDRDKLWQALADHKGNGDTAQTLKAQYDEPK